jgi:adenylyl cyclase-associated protein
VYIGACKQGVVQIKGKCKSITINSCQGTGVVFDETIGPIEVMRSKKVQVQVTGTSPLFQLDKSEGINVYLSKEAVAVAKIFTAECSSININVPVVDRHGEDDMKEHAVPEQMEHKFVDGKLTSEVVIEG